MLTASELASRSLLIDGQWRSTHRTMPVRNPFDGALLAEVACAGSGEVALALSAARRGARVSRQLTTARRAQLLHAVAAIVGSQEDAFAQCISCESGKPITAARKEVRRCINTLTLSAEEATRIVGETINFDSYEGGASRSGYYFYEPLGIVVAITPFNDPLNLVAHKLGPAIAAGNAVILKPSEQAPLSALMLVRAFVEAGLPDGVINVLTGYGSEFGAQLVSAPEVAMVSFTGGEKAGEAIAVAAGARKIAMELGANSPVIVTQHCNLVQAVSACVAGAFWASGQNCIGVQRVYIHRSIYSEFAAAMVAATAQLRVGDPSLDATDVGPMVSPQEASRVHDWVSTAIQQGAELLCGGLAIGHAGYAPTLLSVADQAVPIAEQEVFGPVVTLHAFDDLDAAIEQANRPAYMIHAAIFTSQLQQAMHATQQLRCAGVLINDSTDYRLDAMPFGGAKRGAIGREGVKYAIREMVQTKTVCMNLAN
tara:strand:- start:127492 stop:128940 length:1449 start_codon:yes stop_codon:yes gene_type:complete